MKWNASINFIFYIFFSIMLFDKIQCFLFHYQKKGWIFINSFHIFQQFILFCINYNFVVILMYLFHYACWRTIFIPLSILNDKLQWISIYFNLFFVKKKNAIKVTVFENMIYPKIVPIIFAKLNLQNKCMLHLGKYFVLRYFYILIFMNKHLVQICLLINIRL